MKNRFLNRSKTLVSSFVDECFDVIIECCSTQEHGHLHFNKDEYIYSAINKECKSVPYVHTKNGDIEMYSEDGWLNIDHIAHWADVAVDIVKSIASGDGKHYGY